MALLGVKQVPAPGTLVYFESGYLFEDPKDQEAILVLDAE